MPSVFWWYGRDSGGSGKAPRTWTSCLLLPAGPVSRHRVPHHHSPRPGHTWHFQAPGLHPHSSPPGSQSLPSCLSETSLFLWPNSNVTASGMPSTKVRINCSVLCLQYYSFIVEAVTSLLILSWLEQELTEDRDTVLLFTAPLSYNRSEWLDIRQLQDRIQSSPIWHS